MQGIIGVGQCITDRLGGYRMAGRRERTKCGRDDAAARVIDAVPPIFVPRRIGPQFGRGRLDRRRNDRRLDRPQPVGEGGDGALPLRLRRPKRDEDRVVEIEQDGARQFHAMVAGACGTVCQNSGSWPKKMRAPPRSSASSRSSEASIASRSYMLRGRRRSRRV